MLRSYLFDILAPTAFVAPFKNFVRFFMILIKFTVGCWLALPLMDEASHIGME